MVECDSLWIIADLPGAPDLPRRRPGRFSGIAEPGEIAARNDRALFRVGDLEEAPPEGSGRLAHPPPEKRGERPQALETDFETHLGDGGALLEQKLSRAVEPYARQVLVRRRRERLAE